MLLSDNTIEYNKVEIEKFLIGVLKQSQLKDDQPSHNKPTPFPVLPELMYEQCHQILSGISHGKVIAYDTFTMKDYKEP